ncbi:hypothetical protein AAZX31_17G192000 [Glycine max]|uniref:Enhancer of polycomb-like protein n=1 Tax=Glycine soja TaxID=3848 RepID=A0A445G9C2_GLYSO|nr:uncharacterized protein LOC114392378 [Glycine soja]KAG4931200.1 hypothetical protein JHK86_048161 [Glycine max]RZB57804.1 hypothetical protein D0Y65_046459 [Glycine soja]RZB57805.1 hypothetical protein D0Y65_046459 [Glycine soja]
MEGRAENSNDTTIPKKSRSLDLKSLYKSKLTENTAKKNLKRIGNSSGGGDEKRKKKKARKEVSLSSLENGDGSSELKLGVSQKLSSSSSTLNRVSFSVGDDDVQIPKRKRSFVGRKKSELGLASKVVEQSGLKIGYNDQVPKLGSDDLGSGVESFKIKRKKEFDEFKENRNSDSNSVQHAKENGDCASHSVVNSGDSSLSKSRRQHRKRKASAIDSTKVSKEAEPLVSSSKISDDLQDEEENLEENAARMLSSRFDPSCTGFSMKGSNGLSFFQSSSQSIVNHSLKSPLGSESTSADTAGRVLRPRKQYKNKSNSRKRRHFYEILLGDVDAYWVLNRRIKIFWPLDQSWYYGLVDNYDEGSKLYHIKYDDRDVEWVNLQTERFKLLLLRSEVPGNAKGERALMKRSSFDHQKGSKSRKERQRTEENAGDDRCGESSMDSEPIISWLARSSHRLRSIQGIKKQKTSVTVPSTTSSFLYDEPVTAKGHLAKSSVRDVEKNFSTGSVSQDKFSEDFKDKSSLQSVTCAKDGKQPIVYFRRRWVHKPAPISPHISEENHAIISASGSVALDHMFGGVENVKNPIDSRVEVGGPLFFTYKAGVPKVFWDMKSASFKFGLNFPMRLVLNDFFQSENLWLLYTVLLLRFGAVMAKWPRVCLEMLFVDNVVGLRFLLFEGCLNTAAAFVFFVLRVFHQPDCQGKYVDLQFPCTSVGFKFSSVHVIKKPLVFEFYNFSEVKNSKWMHLDSKLKEHCLLSKQLHLSECTYDNIQALQNGSRRFSITSISGSSSVKVTQKSRPGINIMGVSEVSTQAVQCSDAGERKLPPFALSFAAAPTFFLCLHLKLLMEQSAAHIRYCDQTPIFDQEDPGLMTNGCTSTDNCSNRNSEVILRKGMETLSIGTPGDGGSCADSDHPSTCNDRILIQNYQNIGLNGASTSISHDSEKLCKTHLPEWQSHHLEQELGSLSSSSLKHHDKANDGSHSFIGDLSIQIPAVDQFEKPDEDGDLCDAEHSPDISWNINGCGIPSSNPTARRSSWYRNRNNSLSLGFQSHVWSDGKVDSLCNDLSNGPKKPRTQVSYSVPSAGYEFSSRQRNHHQKGLSHKRVRKAKEKKSSDVDRVPEKNIKCLSCGANVLITLGDKGWRESGAHVVLELFDHNEWRLSVKLLGITRYSYKAHQFLQLGSTNRYTHAMMWKGGKDWILEFPDRSQWALFKEMHEECYNRNIRSASVRNIPIPGVHFIEENDANGSEETFVRSCMYFQQVETDVEMALDPSCVLYDLDSEDEQWISNAQNSLKDNSEFCWISEEMFEKTIDVFEKAAYAKKRDHFTPDEIEELMVNVGPLCVVKIIYDHWQQKRQKKGMALIRHFQPPLWERYQKQVREWELAMTKNNAPSNGCLDKVTTLEKPAMFAFCLKPRGLESLNKGLKHRSQKKISVSGHANSNLDQDGFHTFRRRQNALPFGDEKFLYQGHNYDSFDDSSLALTSPRVFLPRDAGSLKYYLTSNGAGYRNHIPKFHKSRYDSPGSRHHILAGPKRQGIEQLDASVLEELRQRDAMAEARFKRHVAMLKRDRAKRLLYKVDVAIHKAMAALMTAEAMKASEDSLVEMKAYED